jgi:hypothetical protein
LLDQLGELELQSDCVICEARIFHDWLLPTAPGANPAVTRGRVTAGTSPLSHH